MAIRKHHFQNGKSGSALAIRLMYSADKNQVSQIMKDGTIKIQLTSAVNDDRKNKELINFLAGILNTSPMKIEIVAGEDRDEKLVSVIGMTAEDVQKKILKLTF